MKQFESYFTENEIIKLICKVRVKIAKAKCKKHLIHLLTTNPKYNYHLDTNSIPQNEFETKQKELMDFLSTILPSRKRWVKLGEESRRKPKRENEFLTTTDKNFYALLKTIKAESKKASKQEWYNKLQLFISEIIEVAIRKECKIEKPTIFPKLKEVKKKIGKNECRPICIFSLKDRIILSLTNKFLTRLFDEHFQKSSFAFRYKRNDKGNILSHHDCVLEIVKYRKENLQSDLFVTECDMKKFYDTVNHTIAFELFNNLIEKSKRLYPNLELEKPCLIFSSYLKSFAFNIDIPKPTDNEYWKSYNIPNGEFEWICNEDLILQYHIDTKERIGVPQGGALSGLIANIYLNQADIALKDFDILYQRFCDDMIIISKDFNTCYNAKSIYENELRKLKLFPHKFKEQNDLCKFELIFGKNHNIILPNKIPKWIIKTIRFVLKKRIAIDIKPFWDGKSKGPYKWGQIENDAFPWVGFVGYEVNFKGEIRVRKKSLHKELKKQKTIVKEILDSIKTGMRKPKGTATESAINRLIGMSVGRIGLDNFEEVSTDLCWKNGFRELTPNEHSTRQIKQLDRNRNKLYYKMLKQIEQPKLEDEKDEEKDNKQPIQYNKPFSYYYQILERQKKANS